MKSDGVPVLVCLTHADNLYLECVEKQKEYNVETAEAKKIAFRNELQVL